MNVLKKDTNMLACSSMDNVFVGIPMEVMEHLVIAIRLVMQIIAKYVEGPGLILYMKNHDLI